MKIRFVDVFDCFLKKQPFETNDRRRLQRIDITHATPFATLSYI
jgi:hypothetical protein